MADSKRKRKSGRSRRSRGNPRNYSQIYKDDNTIPQAATATPTPQAAAPAADTHVDWQDEYGYVLNDLRLLLIVSAIIFVLMLGAGLILG